ncbi:hypothetical protein DPF_0132 [Desulfoplanes formicivorans]|uniref:Uncharacterized protein n=1 Tax=Desulfoplanes formicivorans TaxID=1592317 RepID=A0A194AE24_9BACT|nr:hypothetical protein DPF_0132 [Desulfoplanes formicivorans]
MKDKARLGQKKQDYQYIEREFSRDRGQPRSRNILTMSGLTWVLQWPRDGRTGQKTFAQPEKTVGKKAYGADVAAESPAKQQRGTHGGQKDHQTRRMDGIEDAGYQKGFESQKSADGEKCLHRRRSYGRNRGRPGEPERVPIKTPAREKTEQGEYDLHTASDTRKGNTHSYSLKNSQSPRYAQKLFSRAGE